MPAGAAILVERAALSKLQCSRVQQLHSHIAEHLASCSGMQVLCWYLLKVVQGLVTTLNSCQTLPLVEGACHIASQTLSSACCCCLAALQAASWRAALSQLACQGAPGLPRFHAMLQKAAAGGDDSAADSLDIVFDGAQLGEMLLEYAAAGQVCVFGSACSQRLSCSAYLLCPALPCSAGCSGATYVAANNP